MAREYLGHILLGRLEEKVQPATTALLIIDMQNDFLHEDGYCAASFGKAMVAGFQDVVAPIRELAGAARAAGVPVVYSKVTQLPDGSLASPVWLADNLRYGFEPLQCMRGSWGWEIVAELAPQPGDVVVEKPRRSVFQGSHLENVLHARGVRSIVAVGIASSGCVESTVRDAIEKDYFVVVPGDCVADSTAEQTEASHAAYQRLLAPEDFTTSELIIAAWAVVTAPSTRE